jgi:putative PIN family toxin of toxin-antitoxin system
MQNKGWRIIIDTNLWISFLITKDFSKLDEIIFSRNAKLVFSQELLNEFLEVVQRPKFRRFFSAKDIEAILETIEEYAVYIKVNTLVEICRDPKDNFLLSLSIDGKADFLITGDKDLLAMNKFGETIILTITEFLNEK